MNTFLRLVLSGACVMLLTYIVPGISVTSFWVALLVALVLGFANAILRPILALLTLPITIVTLGLWVLFINAGLFLVVSYVVPGFAVASFWTAFLGAIVYALLGWGVNVIFGTKRTDALPPARS